MEQPGAPRYHPGAGSRHSHLPGSRGCAQPGPPSRWRMVAPASPQLSRNSVPPRPPHWRGRTRRFPPQSAPRMEGSDPRPRGGGAQWPRRPYLCSPSSSPSSQGLRPPPPSAPLPRSAAPGAAASNQEVPRRDTGDRRYGNPARPRPTPPGAVPQGRPAAAAILHSQRGAEVPGPAPLPAASAAILGSQRGPGSAGGLVARLKEPCLGEAGAAVGSPTRLTCMAPWPSPAPTSIATAPCFCCSRGKAASRTLPHPS